MSVGKAEKRIWTYAQTGVSGVAHWDEDVMPPVGANYGFETFDFGRAIGLWVRSPDGQYIVVRMSAADAAFLGHALMSVECSE